MFTPGPSTMFTPLRHSLAERAANGRERLSRSVRKRSPSESIVAGTERLRPSASESLSCLRRPCGPSVIISDGMPSRSTAFVCQKSRPDVSPAFFLQRQLGNEIGVFHMRALPTL